MSDKLTKTEMREDAFRDALSTVYHRVEHHVENHWRLYLLGLGVFIAAVALGQWLYLRAEARRGEAQFLASRVAEAMGAPILPAGDANRESYQKAGVTFFESEKGREEEVQRRIAAAKAGPGHAATAKVVAMYEAVAAARAGRLDDALALAAPLQSDPGVGALAVLLEARLRESKADAAGAEAAWKRLAGMTGPGFPEGAGSAQLAEYYERAGQTEKARETWAALEATLAGKAGDDDPLLARAKSKAKELKSAA